MIRGLRFLSTRARPQLYNEAGKADHDECDQIEARVWHGVQRIHVDHLSRGGFQTASTDEFGGTDHCSLRSSERGRDDDDVALNRKGADRANHRKDDDRPDPRLTVDSGPQDHRRAGANPGAD